MTRTRRGVRLVFALLSIPLFACMEGMENESVENSVQAVQHETPSVNASPGLLQGIRSWSFPVTPSGMVPSVAWFTVGSAPDGAVYVAGSDYLTNTAMYRLANGSDHLRYVGDARTASEAVDNWLPNETATRFHARPIWYKNRVYNATADFLAPNSGYLNSRGFHWYAYDEKKRDYLDLSHSEVGGVGAPNISIVATALDAPRGLIYALGAPTGHLYQYNISKKTTTDLGRHPAITTEFNNTPRFFWVDSRGGVYFQAGSGAISTWDPIEGFCDNPTWTTPFGLYTGQWSRDHKRLYMMDNPLNLYLFDDEKRTFTLVNTGVLPPEQQCVICNRPIVRNMQLSANERKIYFANNRAPVNFLYEWDWSVTNSPRALAPIQALDSRVTNSHSVVTGNDSWDADGKFYLAMFDNVTPTTTALLLVGVDPVQLKAGLGVLPGVPVVSVQTEQGKGILRRGDTSTSLNVLVESKKKQTSVWLTLPAGATTVALPPSSPDAKWSVIPDGDTYVRGQTCEPGDRRYCHWMGTCNKEGTACQCYDEDHRSPSDQCQSWQYVIVPPGMTCKPGDLSYCNWMGTCNKAGKGCNCFDRKHRLSSERCETYHNR